jgi:hypothetical protein
LTDPPEKGMIDVWNTNASAAPAEGRTKEEVERMKRLIPILLCLVLALGVLVLSAAPARAASESDWTYEITNGEATVTKYNGSGGAVTIPSTLGGCPVTGIDYYAFGGGSSLTSVTIPDSVTSIDEGAFYGCSSLTSVTIPDSVTSIGDSAFEDCGSLMSVTIPDSVISIGSTPFSNFQSKLKTINASEAVYDLLWEELNSTQRFDVSCGCLKNGNVPKIVKQYIRKKKLRFFDAIANDDDVEAMAGFFSCLSQIPVGEIDDYIEKAASAIKIKSFLVDYKEKHFSREETENYFKDQTEKEIGIKERTLAEWRKIFRIDLGTRKAAYISGYYGKDSVVLIPAKVGNNPVLGVDNSAFRRKKDIQKIVIENGVRTIGSEAFNGCASLESVDIPASVNRIGKDVFKGTAVFKEKANWDKNVLYIENHLIKAKPALSGEYSIKEGTRSIAGGAFECCEKLTGVVLPDGVQTIGINAFSGCINLNTVYIPESVTEIFKSEGYGRFNFGSFIDCPNLTIHAPAGSYAEQYAKANNIPFVVE